MSEIIVVIVIMGILALVAVPVYSGIRQASLESAAVQNTRLINAARESYALTVPSGYVNWAGAADDSAKLALLIRENLLGGAPGDYLSMEGGYTLVLGTDLRARTDLRRAGAAINY